MTSSEARDTIPFPQQILRMIEAMQTTVQDCKVSFHNYFDGGIYVQSPTLKGFNCPWIEGKCDCSRQHS